MERLGLWGDGAAFRSFDDFLTTVQKKGLGKYEKVIFSLLLSHLHPQPFTLSVCSILSWYVYSVFGCSLCFYCPLCLLVFFL